MFFIELSVAGQENVIVNVNYIKKVFVNYNGKTCVLGVGWKHAYDYFEVEQSYEDIIQKINERTAKVNRLES